jgi:hypothetical protein
MRDAAQGALLEMWFWRVRGARERVGLLLGGTDSDGGVSAALSVLFPTRAVPVSDTR